MTKTIQHKESLSDKVFNAFANVAFAEAGELYPEHPHRVKSITENFTEVAFAESGEEFHVETEELKPPMLCVNGETRSGLCV